jgi:hypothetical protein
MGLEWWPLASRREQAVKHKLHQGEANGIIASCSQRGSWFAEVRDKMPGMPMRGPCVLLKAQLPHHWPDR